MNAVTNRNDDVINTASIEEFRRLHASLLNRVSRSGVNVNRLNEPLRNRFTSTRNALANGFNPEYIQLRIQASMARSAAAAAPNVQGVNKTRQNIALAEANLQRKEANLRNFNRLIRTNRARLAKYHGQGERATNSNIKRALELEIAEAKKRIRVLRRRT
jgi:hypothetical protein